MRLVYHPQICVERKGYTLTLLAVVIQKCDHAKIYQHISDQNLELLRERLMDTVIWPSDDTNTEKIGWWFVLWTWRANLWCIRSRKCSLIDFLYVTSTVNLCSMDFQFYCVFLNPIILHESSVYKELYLFSNLLRVQRHSLLGSFEEATCSRTLCYIALV